MKSETKNPIVIILLVTIILLIFYFTVIKEGSLTTVEESGTQIDAQDFKELLIGARVRTIDDTLEIIDMSLFFRTVTLSDGKKYNIHYIENRLVDEDSISIELDKLKYE